MIMHDAQECVSHKDPSNEDFRIRRCKSHDVQGKIFFSMLKGLTNTSSG